MNVDCMLFWNSVYRIKTLKPHLFPLCSERMSICKHLWQQNAWVVWLSLNDSDPYSFFTWATCQFVPLPLDNRQKIRPLLRTPASLSIFAEPYKLSVDSGISNDSRLSEQAQCIYQGWNRKYTNHITVETSVFGAQGDVCNCDTTNIIAQNITLSCLFTNLVSI